MTRRRQYRRLAMEGKTNQVPYLIVKLFTRKAFKETSNSHTHTRHTIYSPRRGLAGAKIQIIGSRFRIKVIKRQDLTGKTIRLMRLAQGTCMTRGQRVTFTGRFSSVAEFVLVLTGRFPSRTV